METHKELLVRITKDVKPRDRRSFLEWAVSGPPWRGEAERQELIQGVLAESHGKGIT